MDCQRNINSTLPTQLPHKFSYIVTILGHNHFESPNTCELIIFSYNITSGMIIIDDIMSEIELEISRVRRTSEMSCCNFTNLISMMINHTTCYIR
jgi:hypothetical protein